MDSAKFSKKYFYSWVLSWVFRGLYKFFKNMFVIIGEKTVKMYKQQFCNFFVPMNSSSIKFVKPVKCEKSRVGNLLFGFSCESLVFWEQKSKSLLSLFLKEQQEWFPLLQRARRAMKNVSLFCLGIKSRTAGRKERALSFLFNTHS